MERILSLLTQALLHKTLHSLSLPVSLASCRYYSVVFHTGGPERWSRTPRERIGLVTNCATVRVPDHIAGHVDRVADRVARYSLGALSIII